MEVKLQCCWSTNFVNDVNYGAEFGRCGRQANVQLIDVLRSAVELVRQTGPRTAFR